MNLWSGLTANQCRQTITKQQTGWRLSTAAITSFPLRNSFSRVIYQSIISTRIPYQHDSYGWWLTEVLDPEAQQDKEIKRTQTTSPSSITSATTFCHLYRFLTILISQIVINNAPSKPCAIYNFPPLITLPWYSFHTFTHRSHAISTNLHPILLIASSCTKDFYQKPVPCHRHTRRK